MPTGCASTDSPGACAWTRDWTASASGRADLEAQDLPMSTLTAGLTPAIEYRGD